MSKFTDAERASILEQSRKILADEPPARPEPAPREVRIEFEPVDPVQLWREQADEADRVRADHATRMRREEREERVAMRTRQNSAELEQRLDALEDRVSAIEQHLAGFDALANGAAQFSSAAATKLNSLAALTERLDKTLEQMREVHRREVDALCDRLASSEALHTRETVLLTKQLADAQREIDARANLREHVRTRMEVAGVNENLENVVALVREDIAARKR
jgi:hypothetical protein